MDPPGVSALSQMDLASWRWPGEEGKAGIVILTVGRGEASEGSASGNAGLGPVADR